MKHVYTVTYAAKNGGFSYEIRRHRRLIGKGWRGGRKSNAESAARDEIAGLMAQKAAA